MMNNKKARTSFPHCVMLVFLFCALLVGCASNKPQIKMLEETNFAALKTFYVQPPLNSFNPTLEQHMASTITTVLQGKGLTVASEDEADIRVGFFPSNRVEEGGSSVSIGLGTGVFGRSGGISLGSIFSVPVGEQVTEYQNLQIEVVQDGEFIYSAAGRAELESSDSITVQQALTELVETLLQPFPANRAN
ncbi:MAG: hypothetical protein CL586_04460 [Alteromonadaceae bacterium]|nr:hypothetical protein [Alteromonadaceae bacterium]